MGLRAAAVAVSLALAGVLAGGASGADPGSRDTPRVTVFGDSAATAMAYDPKARSILGAGVELRLEVAACRRLGDLSCPYDGVRPPNVIERASALGHDLGRVVVVAVGYNDYENTYAANIEETLQVLGKAGVERVLWTTLRAERQSWMRMNEMIVAAARKHPEMTVVDWNTRARDNPGWLQPDGIHLTPTGAQAMASMVNATLVELGVAPRAAATVRRLSIAVRTVPSGHAGRAYVARLRALGGSAPYRWTRIRGRVAPGLVLTSDGRLKGIPTRAGRYSFVVRVADRAGTVRARQLVLAILR